MIAFLLFLPLWLVGVLGSYPLVPIAVALADKDGRLPRVFRWLETPDALGWDGGLYEPAVRKTREKWGERAALIHWLWRNKAYGLRMWMRADPKGIIRMSASWSHEQPPRWGAFYWFCRITADNGSWFELAPGVGLGGVHVYFRIGWKLKPFFDGVKPAANTSAGAFTGITPRMDDWDDFRGGA